MDRNYQKELEKLISNLEKEEKVPTLFLHSCCMEHSNCAAITSEPLLFFQDYQSVFLTLSDNYVPSHRPFPFL